MRSAAILSLLLLPAAVLAQIIPPPPSMAWLACAEPVSLFCDPAGGGYPLTQARALNTPNGQWVDATIIVELVDGWGDPVADYPPEDLWLGTTGDDLVLCDGGARADAPTDVNGRTTISGVLGIGGHLTPLSPDRLQVMTPYGPIGYSSLEDLSLTSPDLDGDLDVDLGDVILFAERYLDYPNYDATVDFHYDGVINLSDLVLMVQHRNLACD